MAPMSQLTPGLFHGRLCPASQPSGHLRGQFVKNELLLLGSSSSDVSGVLYVSVWPQQVEFLSATLGFCLVLWLPRTLGYWPLAIGRGSMDGKPKPLTVSLSPWIHFRP